MTSPTTFHLFPKLPSELRIKVWNIALSLPRVVRMSCKKERLKRTHHFTKSFVSHTAVPVLLQVCRESRLEGFLTYKPMFKTDTSPVYTYVSFEHDIILCADSVLLSMEDEEVERVQKLVLEVKDVAYFGHFQMDILMRMKKLRELDLRIEDGVFNWDLARGYRDSYVDIMRRDFKQARTRNPEWECPDVRILDRETGKELSVIPGGAAPPESMEDWIKTVAEQAS
jgi:hypothetical protein